MLCIIHICMPFEEINIWILNFLLTAIENTKVPKVPKKINFLTTVVYFYKRILFFNKTKIKKFK